MSTMTFGDVVLYCSQNREFVENFDRLNGTNLSTIGRRSGLDAAIDQATGRDEESMVQFCAAGMSQSTRDAWTTR